MTSASPSVSPKPRWRRRVMIGVGVIVLLPIIFWFLLTDPAPLVPSRAAPTALEVGAGRDAYRQLRAARESKTGARLLLTATNLDGVGAIVSHGFRPDRLNLAIVDNVFQASGSHRLTSSRWLNVTLRSEGPSDGFPSTRLTVGSITLPPLLTRWALQVGTTLVGWRRHVDIPEIDQAVRQFSIHNGVITAMVTLPGTTGLVDQMAGVVGEPIDGPAVVRIYCSLAKQQHDKPSKLFADQVNRAFSLDPAGVAPETFNNSAFIALGMFYVDPRVADLAHVNSADGQKCGKTVAGITIYDRDDWPKHFTLSAAIAVSSGSQLSEAVGEWKELADSISRQSQFSIGDPSGFSMADLGSDRAGFRVARAAGDPASATRMRKALATATEQQLIPHALIEREDGLSNAEFVKRYGGLDDPRFKARVAEIDAVLVRSGIR